MKLVADATTDSPVGEDAPRVVRVLPDVAAIDKEFDYLLPDRVHVGVGDVVRIDLQGRRVGGWVTAVDVTPRPDTPLKPLAKVSGRGPAPELLDLAAWAAWRWAGRRASIMRTASPPGVVRAIPDVASPAPSAEPPVMPADIPVETFEHHRVVLRLAPGVDRWPLVAAMVAAAEREGGSCLILCPAIDQARGLGVRLQRAGVTTAVLVDGPGRAGATEWARAAGGSTAVLGARAAAFAPVKDLRRVLVMDEHDEAYQQEQAPTWHARDVAVERAARLGARAVLVSPCPTLEAMGWGTLVTTDRSTERSGWSRLEVVDQRELDPSLGPLFSPRLVQLVRGDRRVVCVLNRTGRGRLLACGACTSIARCERCDSAVSDEGGGTLTCRRCGTERPVVCTVCGGARFKNLRLGVSRAREELEMLVGEPVAEVSAKSPSTSPTRVTIGTEAVLHRVDRADSVAFLDFDQELLAPRYRSAEQALALLARATRLVQRANAPGGRLLVQTRSPDHAAIVAASNADPTHLSDSELPLRQALGFPPTVAMAVVSGPAAEAFMAQFDHRNVKVQGPVDGTWRLVGGKHEELCDALARTPRPGGRLRIEVDPLNL